MKSRWHCASLAALAMAISVGACGPRVMHPSRDQMPGATPESCVNGAVAEVVNPTSWEVDVRQNGRIIGSVSPGSSGQFGLPPGPVGGVTAAMVPVRSNPDKSPQQLTGPDPRLSIRLKVTCNP